LDRQVEWIITLSALGVAVLCLAGLIRLRRRSRRRRRRIQHEDVLKQVCSARQEGRPVTVSEIGGRLGLVPDAMLTLIEELEEAGFLRSKGGILEPTETGERLGLQVLRGHRIWERHLSDEAQQPLDRLHDLADRAEHRLGVEQIEALSDHLGHPRRDPHGDVIPAASGEFPEQERMPLTDWPCDRLAVVVHVEDEPGQALKEALAAGLYPGTVLRVVETDAGRVTFETTQEQQSVTSAVAAQIDVRGARAGEALGPAPATLADLGVGNKADVVGLKDNCSGLMRRRLLDLGFTPGAEIAVVLSNVGDEAHAYRIRNTLIALRQEQADKVLVSDIETAEMQDQPDERTTP
jgi:DtxR family Mn-dependent transcriptional regulator